jgi:1-aminocyclopropane-1-carboxylate deaminase/D-cysteine desulfhydrase-like pyridoxal-dependent ACC family enzyme
VVSDEKPREVNGNLLLDTLLGADIRFAGGHEDDLDPKLDAAAEELSGAGRRPYVIKKFGSVPLGTIGYANAFLELVNQLNERSLSIDHIVVAGKGGTYAGLYLAARAMNSDIDIAAVAISELQPNWRGEICDLIRDGAALLGVELDAKPDELHVLTEYFGEEYGAPTKEMVEAIKLTAQTEGILLDPIYTGKAMAALIDQARKGAYRREANVLFWHTGGTPTLFTPQYRNLFL